MQLFITSGVQKPLFEFIVENQKYFSFWFCYNLQLLSIARTVQSQKKAIIKNTILKTKSIKDQQPS